MLNRRRRNQTPTFLEGTPGRYMRRETPPAVPSCNDSVLSVLRNTRPAGLSTQSLEHRYADGNIGSLTVGSTRPKSELSSQSFNDSRSTRYSAHKRTLASSLSIGDVAQYGAQTSNVGYGEQRVVSMSLQSLPGRTISSTMVNDGLVSEKAEEELPLPPNWAIEVTGDGIRYYVDHNTRRTHWIHPFVKENLPPGWTKQFDPVNGVLYYNTIEDRTQLEHPGLATSNTVVPQNSSSVHLSQYAESTIENLNIIGEDIPNWLQLYSKAPFELDSLLDWRLFPLHLLEKSDIQLRKLYKQDVIDTVIKYERFRREIAREMNQRQRKL